MDARSFIYGLIIHLLLFVPADAQERKEVLVISSYNSRFPTFFQQIEGIQSVFDTNNVDFDLEFMDSKRFPDSVSKSLFADLLSFKLSNYSSYDAIISTDDNALNFVIEYQDKLFKDIPIVFCGINNAELAMMQNQNPWITGVMESISMRETIELMLGLYPDQKTIYAIVDNTTSGQADLRTYYRVAQTMPNIHFDEISLQTLLFDEYIQKLRTIPSTSPVLLISAYQDRSGKTINFEESISIINRNLRAPLFHVYQHGMGEGVLGGKIISHYEQGKTAALLVSDILSGYPTSSINVITESPNVFMFDYKEVIKHQLNPTQLPEDAQFINLPVSFYQRYKSIIHFTILIIVFLLVFILILSINILRRREAERRLKEQNESYLQLNSEYLIQNEELKTHRNHLEELVVEKTKDLAQKNDLLAEKNLELEHVLKDLKGAQLQLVQSEKMASLGLLTAGVAHEINNPLNYISGSYSLLERILDQEHLKTDEIQELLGNLKIGVDRASDIVKSLNQFSHSQNHLDEDCSIHTILENCLLILNHQLKHRIEVIKDFAPVPLGCCGSVGKLHQAFINILNNSIQAIEQHGTITISTFKKEDTILIKFSDSGCGIKKEDMKKIFDPFFTTKEPGKGTGLGMSITYNIITDHKGTIEVSSEEDKGTTTIITLPAKSE